MNAIPAIATFALGCALLGGEGPGARAPAEVFSVCLKQGAAGLEMLEPLAMSLVPTATEALDAMRRHQSALIVLGVQRFGAVETQAMTRDARFEPPYASAIADLVVSGRIAGAIGVTETRRRICAERIAAL